MPGLTFLHPALLWGLLLAALPLIIHLLSRRRYRRRAWAAMELLLAALRRRRRRIWLRELLLLLLRTAAMVLLALLVARPVSSGAGLLAALAGDQGVHHVVVLDDSASMGQVAGGRTLLAAAAAGVLDLADSLLVRRRGDQLTVLAASRPERPLLAGRPLSAEARSTLARELADPAPTGLKLAPESLLPRLLAALPDLAGPEERQVALYLVSDFRRADWTGGDDGPRPEVADALAGLAQAGVEPVALAVPGLDGQGLGIAGLALASPLRSAGVPLDLIATFRNQGTAAAAAVRPTLSAGGRTIPLPPLPPLAPGQEAAVPCRAAFPAEGFQVLTVSLPGDDLPADNERHLVVEVVEAARILVAADEAGEAGPGPGFYLASALAPGGTATGLAPEACPPAAAGGRDPDGYDVLILAGAAAPPPALAARLESFVNGGGGLLLFTGPATVPAAWNAALGALLPFPIGEPLAEGGEPPPVRLAAPEHPLVARAPAFFAEWLDRLVLTGRSRPGGPLAPGGCVLARAGDGAGDPLIAEKRIGAGKVLLVGLAADASWSAWVGDPIFPLFLQEACSWLLRPPPAATWNVTCGAPLTATLDPARDAPRLEVLAPGDPAAMPGRVEGRKAAFAGTGRPGVYRLRFPAAGQGPAREELRAANLDPDEGRLRLLDRSGLFRLYPQARIRWLPAAEAGPLLRSGEEDRSWRVAAAALLLCLLLETLLARLIGREGAP